LRIHVVLTAWKQYALNGRKKAGNAFGGLAQANEDCRGSGGFESFFIRGQAAPVVIGVGAGGFRNGDTNSHPVQCKVRRQFLGEI
jgi:hypothetical protein